MELTYIEIIRNWLTGIQDLYGSCQSETSWNYVIENDSSHSRDIPKYVWYDFIVNDLYWRCQNIVESWWPHGVDQTFTAVKWRSTLIKGLTRITAHPKKCAYGSRFFVFCVGYVGLVMVDATHIFQDYFTGI